MMNMILNPYKVANRRVYSNVNEQMCNINDRDAPCSLLDGMLSSIPREIGTNNLFLDSIKTGHFQLHSKTLSKSEMDAIASSHPYSGFPKDAFEPVPIRPRALAPALDSSVLERALDETLDALHHTPSSCRNEKDDLFDGHPCDAFEPVPFQEGGATSSVQSLDDLFSDESSILELSAPLLFNGVNKRSSPASYLTEDDSSAPNPKRRRTSSDESDEPSLRGYQAKQWTAQFNELVQFKEQHGHCLVPHTYPENQILSRWVKRQRYQYKLKKAGKVSTMTEARIKQLEDIGFVWDSHAVTWNKRFKELQQYRNKHGDCNVPSNFPENQDLAVWIKCQRRQYKLFWSSNKSSSMTLDRMRKLNELGFIWKVRDDPPLMVNREHFQWDQAIS